MKRMLEAISDWLLWFQFVHLEDWDFIPHFCWRWPKAPGQWYHGAVYRWVVTVGPFEVRRWTRKPSRSEQGATA